MTVRPWQLGDNRVPVYYAGGEHIDDFRGGPGERSGPEDWVGSLSALPAAILGTDHPADTGISRLPDGTSLADVVRADPQAWLGHALAARFAGETGLLVKLLDAGERLPVHCHPSRRFAQRHLGTYFGKTEGWVVMHSAPGSRIWLGMRETVEPSDWMRWTAAQDATAMLGAMNEVAVGAGEVVYVPAGLPHAIGPGVMLTELQEPTSFSVLAEHAAYGLDAEQATLGLGWDLALSCFDLDGYAGRLADLIRPAPPRDPGVRNLFPDAADEFFRAVLVRSDGDGVALAEPSFAVLVVTAGSGSLEWSGETDGIGIGQTWVVPHGAGPLTFRGIGLEAIVCLPPSETGASRSWNQNRA